MEKLLDVNDLVVGYDGAIAVDKLSLEVFEGEFVAVLGANGAGKTTFLNCIMGVVPQQSGTVTFLGSEISPLRTEERVKRGIVIVPERRELFPELNVQDHLVLGAYLLRGRNRTQTAQALDRIYNLLPKLRDRRSQVVKTLSGGEQQMVAVGRALMSEPKLLLLDEPSTGLAPRIVEEIFETISILRREGMTGIVVEQNANAALSIADRGLVLEVGNIVSSGNAVQLRADPAVVSAYLGAGDRYREISAAK